MQDLTKQFDQAMHNVYRRAKDEAGYNATIFLDMLFKKGRLATAKFPIDAAAVSDGYTALWERGRLDLSVEAVVVEDPKWHPLFTEQELARAERRLKKYQYQRR